jgi:outer membrane immunogenic protein
MAAPAFAADMPVKAPPVAAVPTASSWDGFYLGADAGYGIGITNFNQPFQGDFVASHGFTGGLLGGYNHMLAPRWLAGVEADVNWGNVAHNEKFDDGFGDVLSIKLSEKEAGSLRGRFGYLLEPNTLLYITGGWSWARFSYAFASTLDGNEASNVTLNGPEVGFGAETLLGGGWSARFEYLEAFYNYGNFASPLLGTAINLLGSTVNFGTIDEKPAVGVGRFALIYRFGAGDAAPSAAPSPTLSWNGPTIAATVAAVSATAKVDSWAAPDNAIDGVGASAVLPTVLAGYDWRIAPRWVFGVDVGAAPGLSTTKIRLDWTEASHARIGYLITPATMVYTSVGWFGTGFETTQLLANVSVPQQRTNALEIGGGVEAALDAHWAARFEYQYGIMQTIRNVIVTISGTAVPPSVQLPVSLHPEVQSAQAGLVYHFDID